jgi:hypothetical protein
MLEMEHDTVEKTANSVDVPGAVSITVERPEQSDQFGPSDGGSHISDMNEGVPFLIQKYINEATKNYVPEDSFSEYDNSDQDEDYKPEDDKFLNSSESDDVTEVDNEHKSPEAETVEDSMSDKSVEIPVYKALANHLKEPHEKPVRESGYDIDSDGDSTSTDEPDEDEIIRSKDCPQIYVARILQNSTTKCGKKKKTSRVYNSHHPCPFCKKLYPNFATHVTSKKHSEEPEVLRIKQERDKERKRLLNLLRMRAVHEHNKDVLENKKGQLILERRPTAPFDVAKYGPCPHCFGWLRLSVIDRHQSKCPGKKGELTRYSRGQLLVQSSIVCGRMGETASQKLLSEVFPIMLNDRISEVAKSDPLIVMLGNLWLQRNVGNKVMRKYYTSSVMRLSARLRIQLNEMQPLENNNLEHYLKPEHFDMVVKAALACAAQDADDEEDLATPSNAIKLHYDLQRLTSIKMGIAMKIGDTKTRKDCKTFLKLITMQYSNRLARVLLQERRFNIRKPLPLPEDIQKLCTFLKKELSSLDLNDSSSKNYLRATKLAEARLILYNRRRCGELQAML